MHRQRLGRFVNPEDELLADGTKLLERVGALAQTGARMTSAGESFFVREQRKPSARSFSFRRG
jgi:hypothetical protein